MSCETKKDFAPDPPTFCECGSTKRGVGRGGNPEDGPAVVLCPDCGDIREE